MHNDRDKKSLLLLSLLRMLEGVVSFRQSSGHYQSIVNHISQFEREAHDTRAEARSVV